MFIKNALITSTILLAAATSVQATTYDFTYSDSTERAANGTKNGGSHSTNGRGYGNTFDTGNLSVSAWGTTGSGSSGPFAAPLETGEIWDWQTGLGACNRAEGIAGSGCSTGNSSNSEHQVDTVSFDDLVLFFFDETVSFDEIVIDPFFTSDVDVTYWVGNIGSSDLSGISAADLLNGPVGGFGTFTDILFNGTTNAPQTLSLTGTGNALLIGGQSNHSGGLGNPNGSDNDSFKIASLTATAVVPVPAAVWLFGSGLLGLVGVARRKAA